MAEILGNALCLLLNAIAEGYATIMQIINEWFGVWGVAIALIATGTIIKRAR